jgi:hypothetical protein
MRARLAKRNAPSCLRSGRTKATNAGSGPLRQRSPRRHSQWSRSQPGTAKDRATNPNRPNHELAAASPHLITSSARAEAMTTPRGGAGLIGRVRLCVGPRLHAEESRTRPWVSHPLNPRDRVSSFEREAERLSHQPIASVLKRISPQLLTIADPAIRLQERRFLAIHERERLQRKARSCFSRSSAADHSDANYCHSKRKHRSDDQHDRLHPRRCDRDSRADAEPGI